MNKYAILSTDSNPDYWRLLPLVCYSWRKLGYTPIVYSFGLTDQVFALLMKYKVSVVKYNSYDGVKDSTMAQLIRLFATPGNLDDILITGDADMVIAKDIFTHDGEVISYGYDLTGRSEIPICYVKATTAKWRELMGDHLTIPAKSYSDKWEDYWSVDQQLLTQRAKEFGMNRITFVDRGNGGPGGLPTGRWDRHGWIKPAEIIDVHMKRNDWNAQFEVFKTLWPEDDMQFLIDFKNDCELPVSIVIDNKAADEEMLNKSLSEICKQFNVPDILISSGLSTPPGQLDDFRMDVFMSAVSRSDQFHFLEELSNWCNHRGMLLLALSLTDGDVIELGSGEGSTHQLSKYCSQNSRLFKSYDNNPDWAQRLQTTCVQHWDTADIWHPCSLLFVDHAPGEHRRVAIERMKDKAEIIVIHDTEEGGAGDYKLSTIWPLFKYRLNHNRKGGGAGASMLSNTIDVTKFRGLSLGNYKFDND